MSRKYWVALVLCVALLLASCSFGAAVQEPVEQGDSTSGTVFGDYETLAIYGSFYPISVVKFPTSDMLYLVGGSYYSITPYLDVDGSPVTYKEFQQRVKEASQ